MRELAAPAGVLRAIDFHERGPAQRRLETPLLGSVLLVSTGPPMEVDGATVGSFAAGLYDRPVITGHGGEQSGVQLYLSPLAARRALGWPMDELANRVVALEDLGLRDETAVATVQRRLADGPPPRLELRHALQRLVAGARVEAVAGELGWSRRQLAAQFRRELGLAPRTVARLARAARAAAMLRRGDDLADVAYALGYADQPHFTREFKAFAGVTPGRFPNLQDTAAAA